MEARQVVFIVCHPYKISTARAALLVVLLVTTCSRDDSQPQRPRRPSALHCYCCTDVRYSPAEVRKNPTACRMESTSQPGCIHVSAVTAELLGPGVPLVSTGGVEVKGKVGSIQLFNSTSRLYEPLHSFLCTAVKQWTPIIPFAESFGSRV